MSEPAPEALHASERQCPLPPERPPVPIVVAVLGLLAAMLVFSGVLHLLEAPGG